MGLVKKIGAITMIGLLFGMIGCEEQFDFSTDRDAGTRLVINGIINQGSAYAAVEITQTQSVGAPRPVAGACVEVINERNERLEFKEQGQGVYTRIGPAMVAEPGGAYYLEVELISGEMFRSSPDTMAVYGAGVQIDWREYDRTFTSEAGIDFQLPVVGVSLTAALETVDEPLYLTWLGEETYQFVPTDFPDPFGAIPPPCYIIQPFGSQQVNLFSNLGYNSNIYEIEEVFWREIDKSFIRKHIFSVYQYSISLDYHEYIRKIEDLVENSGSLFDTPPGQIFGNIEAVSGTEENPLGFFAAVLTDTIRIAVYPTQLDEHIVDDCEFDPGRSRALYDELCINCSLAPRTTGRPDYWVRY